MLLLLVLLLLVSFLLTGWIRQYALAGKLMDVPNQRSSHTVPTPRGGGLAIVLCFLGVCLWTIWSGGLEPRLLAIAGAGILIAGIGFYDDHAHVPARWRLLTHVLAASLALLALGGLPLLWIPSPFDSALHRLLLDLHWLAYPLGAFFLVWCVNLFNFMDGTDGIAASESLFVSAALAAYAYYLDQTVFAWGLALAATSAGFLGWNWPKAKIFMGDVGSGFLGLNLGVLILLSAQQAAVMLYCGLILFGIFFVDATYTLSVRILTRQRWYDAHCSHTYQRAAKRFGHLPVLLACWLINLLWLLPISYWAFLYPSHALLALAIAYLPLLMLAVRFRAGQADWAQA